MAWMKVKVQLTVPGRTWSEEFFLESKKREWRNIVPEIEDEVARRYYFVDAGVRNICSVEYVR